MLIVYLMSAGGICRAQSTERTSLEFDLDLRARIAAIGNSRTALHDSSFRFKTSLAPGLHAEVYGAHKYTGFLAQQAVLERDRGAQRVQLGVIRIPFGIYDYRETYASGLIDYPMPRVDYGLHSVDWGVPGVQWTGGTPTLQIEAAAFEGRAAGVWSNANNVGGGALRIQTYARDLIVGVSHWTGYFQAMEDGVHRRNPVHTSGLDVRYTRPHLLIRGEYLLGGMGDDYMHGWYLDVYYHLPKYEKWTFAARLEQLRPGEDDPLGKQVTFGVRYTADPNWIFSVNWRRNNGSSFYHPTWTPYAGKGGDVFLQVYRKLGR